MDDIITPGTAALFVLVLEGLKPFIGKAKVLQTSLTKDKEEESRRALEQASAAASGK